MKKIILLLIAGLMVLMLGSCSNTLFNASGVFISEITAINLPEEGTYALAGAFFDPAWTNDNLATASENLEVTWTFDPPIEVPVNNADFKITKSGTWQFAVEGGLKDPHGNANIFKAEGIVIDGGTWKITFDSSKTQDEAMTAEK